MHHICKALFFFTLSFQPIYALYQNNLLNDLIIVDYWNQHINDRFPVTYNNFLQGGYFIMPSARMGEDGEIGSGYTNNPPYRSWNLRVQLTRFLEVTGNYRIFTGVDDPILSPLGFGDFSDKGANIKISLFRPEDSQYELPGLAIGFDDIIGTRNFMARYIVATKVFLKQNMELSIGYGEQRIHGFFGGFSWMPWRKYKKIPWLQGVTLAVEFDATPYKSEKIEKHPAGRVKKSPFNLGLKYRLWNHIDLSVSYIRGNAVAYSASGFYNFGQTKGILPKIEDPLPYSSPVNLQPLSPLRSENVLVQDLLYAFRDQGIEFLAAWTAYNDCLKKTLRLSIYNGCYRQECVLRERITHVLAALVPNDYEEVIVIIESEGFPIQEYKFYTTYLRDYLYDNMCDAELAVLSPLQEVTFKEPYTETLLFEIDRRDLCFEFYPRIHTFFGSSKGKFKYTLGIGAAINGYLPWNILYSVKFGISPFNDINFQDVDRLNPSQLINVRTDVFRYYRQKNLALDEAYLQKNWTLGKGWYTKLAAGYFEEEYAGAATEILYYPLDWNFAWGVEGALFLKRKYTGLGFTRKVRKLHGFIPHYYHHFIGAQYFLDLYFDWRYTELTLKAQVGKFLANDFGARFEISRYFPSGLQINIWYTVTNGHDHINGRTYYDKGIGFSMPLDMFLCCSDRDRWGNSMSAWLRDVGVQAETGLHLYNLIREQRE